MAILKIGRWLNTYNMCIYCESKIQGVGYGPILNRSPHLSHIPTARWRWKRRSEREKVEMDSGSESERYILTLV